MANEDPCLSVDPAAEVREAHGVQSLPHEQRRIACGQYLAPESTDLAAATAAAAASVLGLLLCRKSCRWDLDQENSDCQKTSICSRQKQALDGVSGSSRYLTVYINIEPVLHKKKVPTLSHETHGHGLSRRLLIGGR